MKKIIFIFTALASFILFEHAGFSAENETHEGFYMNVLSGGGYSRSVARKLSSDEPEFTGMAGLFRFRAGYAPVEDIIFFGSFGITKVYYADSRGDSLTLPVNDLALSYHDYGIGVAIYIPLNICIAGEMSKSRLLWYADDDKYYSDNGASFTFSLGKEWWIAEEIGRAHV